MSNEETKKEVNLWEVILPNRIYQCPKCKCNIMTEDIREYHYCYNCGMEMEGVNEYR